MINKKSLAFDIIKVIMLPVLVYLFFYLASDGRFGSKASLLMIAQQSLAPTLISLAMAPNMLCGRMDLSAGSIVMLAAMFSARLVNDFHLGLVPFAAVCIGAAIILGTLSGFLYLKMRVPAIVTALGICMVYETLSNLSSISWVTAVKGNVTILGKQPYNFILFAIMFTAFYFLLNHSKFGYHVRAIANGQHIARNSGINIKKNAFMCYAVSGIILGVAALLKISIQGSIDTPVFMSSTNIIFNCMLGIYIGIALERYCNLTIGILVGNIIMNMMASGLLSMGLSASLQDTASGVVLLVIMIFTYNNQRVMDFIAEKKERQSVIKLNA